MNRLGALRRPRRQLSSFDNVVVLVAALIVAVAVYEGVHRHVLSLATVIYIVVLLPTIVFHEVAHGVVAYWCGDDTAKRAGRISARPMRHVDPIGTVLVPIALVLLGGPGFGWARPVPVSLNRLRHPRNQAVLVALAGPFSNALLATASCVGLHFLIAANHGEGAAAIVTLLTQLTFNSAGALYWVMVLVGFLGLVNLFVGAFNLIPIPPLDGSALLERLIPIHVLPTYYRLRMAFLVVVFLFLLLERGVLSTVYAHLATWYVDLAS